MAARWMIDLILPACPWTPLQVLELPDHLRVVEDGDAACSEQRLDL
jgi:hypothetical protein